MKNTNRLGEVVKGRREGLGLTQRSLALKLGVQASHVAFIEGGRRKPSLKLVARIADSLGLDRKNLLILAHPEAKAFLVEAKADMTRPQRSRFGCPPAPHWGR
jgi:transcriptional regulator with XRE-family HTH domain